MDKSEITLTLAAARKKMAYLKCNPAGFVLMAMMAGCFCALGMALAYSISGSMAASEFWKPLYKTALGMTFTLSFTLITFAGSELFTGNVFTISMSALEKETSVFDAIKYLVLCYAFNLLGAACMALIFGGTGLIAGDMGALITKANEAKMSIPFFEAFMRGAMCNILVCLAVWTYTRLKSEVAKMIVLLWCVMGFIIPGFEHSIANMALFVMGYFADASAMHVEGILSNLVPVSLGNLAGGSVFVALIYWLITAKKLPKQD